MKRSHVDNNCCSVHEMENQDYAETYLRYNHHNLVISKGSLFAYPVQRVKTT